MKPTQTRTTTPRFQSNRILDSLPKTVLEGLSALEPVYLESGVTLHEPDEQIEQVYFLFDALVSMVALNSEGTTLELVLIGREGMVGLPAVLGGRIPYAAIVHKPGYAMRTSVRRLCSEFRKSRALQAVLLRYTNEFLVRVAQSGVCNRYHTLEERFCRWLLAARDGGSSDSIPVTHEMISRLLGVRRASITVAANDLQRAGAIRLSRGRITVLDAARLREKSCECYTSDGRR